MLENEFDFLIIKLISTPGIFTSITIPIPLSIEKPNHFLNLELNGIMHRVFYLVHFCFSANEKELPKKRGLESQVLFLNN